MRRSIKGIARHTKTRVKGRNKKRTKTRVKGRNKKRTKTRVKRRVKTRVRKHIVFIGGASGEETKGDLDQRVEADRFLDELGLKMFAGGLEGITDKPWSISSLAGLHMDALANIKMSDVHKNMLLKNLTRWETAQQSIQPLARLQGAECDDFLEGPDLLKYKGELQGITAKPWSITSLTSLNMDALAYIKMKHEDKVKLLKRLDQYSSGAAAAEEHQEIVQYRAEKRKRESLAYLGITTPRGVNKRVSEVERQGEISEADLADARKQVGKWVEVIRPGGQCLGGDGHWFGSSLVGRIAELDEGLGAIKVEYADHSVEWYELKTVCAELLSEQDAAKLEHELEMGRRRDEESAKYFASASSDPYGHLGWDPDGQRGDGLPDWMRPLPKKVFKISKAAKPVSQLL